MFEQRLGMSECDDGRYLVSMLGDASSGLAKPEAY